MRLLITGAAGELGGGVLRALSRRQERFDAVVAVDLSRPDAPTAALPADRLVWHDLDVATPALSRLIADAQVDCVIHCAAITGTAAERDPEATLALNTHVTEGIASALSKSGPDRRLVLASSIAALGVFPAGQTADETAARRPRSAYGLSKALSELKLEVLRQSGGLDARALRLPTLLVRKGERRGRPTTGYLSDLVKAFRADKAIVLPAPPNTPVAVNAGSVAAEALVEAALMAPETWGASALANLPAYPATAALLLSLLRDLAGTPGPDVIQDCDPALLAKVGAWPQALSSRLAQHLDPGHAQPPEARLRRLLMDAPLRPTESVRLT